MENGVMIQYFEWNLPNDGKHWQRLKDDAKHLSEIGVSGVWIPPAYKGTSQFDVGYGAYDLWDLGEFDQKGTVRTKYGTKQELIEAIEELHKYNINVYLDAVLNHKGGADETENFLAIEVDPEDRTVEISDPFEIEGWTKFTFPGRNDKYSAFKWNYNLFDGIDFDNKTGKTAIYKIVGENKDWDEGVDSELGNELKIDGFRMDAVKHIKDEFIAEFLTQVRAAYGEEFYSVGEYWRNDLEKLKEYLNNVGYKTDLFDVGLHFNMYDASKKKKDYDLREIFEHTIVETNPMAAVTFVDNHDSQKGSALESQVEDWFIPHSYAIILLSKDGYPCLFYGDYYGVGGEKSPHQWIIDKLLEVRRIHAYGEQINHLDNPNVIAIQRTGRDEWTGCVAVLSNSEEEEEIQIELGKERAGEVWHEVTGSGYEDITIDEEGNADFKVEPEKISVWIRKS